VKTHRPQQRRSKTLAAANFAEIPTAGWLRRRIGNVKDRTLKTRGCGTRGDFKTHVQTRGTWRSSRDCAFLDGGIKKKRRLGKSQAPLFLRINSSCTSVDHLLTRQERRDFDYKNIPTLVNT
jgi:hypothetical protein